MRVGWIVTESSIDWGALDGLPVRFICAQIAPEETTLQYLETLALIARLTHDIDLVRSAIKASSADELRQLISDAYWQADAAPEIHRRYSAGNPNSLRELATHFGEGQWQEVILHLLASAERTLFEDFMREVASRPAFGQHAELVQACVDNAIAVSPKPFLELAQHAPGHDPEFWQRQMIALRVLHRIAPQEIRPLARNLSSHPSHEIQEWLGGQLAGEPSIHSPSVEQMEADGRVQLAELKFAPAAK